MEFFRWAPSPTFCAHLFKAAFQQHHRDMAAPLGRLIPADGLVFDVGAHAGQFSKLFASIAAQGSVIAFEPATYTRTILRLALWRNRVRNVAVVPCALGDAPSVQLLSVPIKRRGSFGYGLSHLGTAGGERPVAKDIVVVSTVDEVVRALSITRLDFLKADIEGWELRMLHGARDSLARFRPAMMLELYPDHLRRAGDTLEAAEAFLAALGYVRAAFVDGRFVAGDRAQEWWLPRERLAG